MVQLFCPVFFKASSSFALVNPYSFDAKYRESLSVLSKRGLPSVIGLVNVFA